MKKRTAGTGFLLATLATGVASIAWAAPPKMAPKMAPKMGSHTMSSHSANSAKPGTSQMTGTVLSMTSHSLTVAPAQKNKMGARKTVAIPTSAKIMQGSKTVKLASLKAGERVLIMMKGGSVSSVRVLGGAMSGSKMGGSKMSHKMSGSKMSGAKMNKKM